MMTGSIIFILFLQPETFSGSLLAVALHCEAVCLAEQHNVCKRAKEAKKAHSAGFQEMEEKVTGSAEGHQNKVTSPPMKVKSLTYKHEDTPPEEAWCDISNKEKTP